MIHNYITDADLKQFHPNLTKQLWVGSSTFTIQIDEAFQRLYVDLYNKNLDPRLIMTPLDLKASSSTPAHSFPVTTVDASSITGNTIDAVANTNRFVVEIDSVSGTWSITLQGSDNKTEWQDISDCLIDITLADNYTKKFTKKYKYYRYVSILKTATGEISYTAYLIDSLLDLAIIYKAFEIIFGDFTIAKDDRYSEFEKKYEKLYNSLLTSIKMQYDADDSGIIEEAEEVQTKQIYFIR